MPAPRPSAGPWGPPGESPLRRHEPAREQRSIGDAPSGGRRRGGGGARPGVGGPPRRAPWGGRGGKILVDATNPLGGGVGEGLAVGHTTSGAEQVAGWAPAARVVKAFNTTGWPNMKDPDYAGQPATMLVCGDDEGANRVVADLATSIGFEAIDAGPLRIARLLEPFAMLWIHLALFRGMGTGIAFRLLRR